MPPSARPQVFPLIEHHLCIWHVMQAWKAVRVAVPPARLLCHGYTLELITPPPVLPPPRLQHIPTKLNEALRAQVVEGLRMLAYCRLSFRTKRKREEKARAIIRQFLDMEVRQFDALVMAMAARDRGSRLATVCAAWNR